MFDAVWTSFFRWVVKFITGFLDKFNVTALYAFSPQFDTFIQYFKPVDAIYNLMIYISLGIGIIIFLYKISEGIVSPNSKFYESPISIIIRFAGFLIVLALLPTMMGSATKIANTVYWDVSNKIASEDADYEKRNRKLFEVVMETMIISINSETASDGNSSDANAGEDSESDASDLEKAFQDAVKDNDSLKDAANSSLSTYIDDNIDGSWSKTKVDSGILVEMVSLLLLITMAKQYIFYIIEMAERYVVFFVQTICAPLAIAPMCSAGTQDITKRFFRMYFGELIVLCFSAFFLVTFKMVTLWGMEASGSYYSVNGTQVGGNVLYILLLIGFLKTGQKIDTYLNVLGLNTAQTGMGMMQACMPEFHNAARSVKEGAKKGGSAIGGLIAGAASSHLGIPIPGAGGKSSERAGADGLTDSSRAAATRAEDIAASSNGGGRSGNISNHDFSGFSPDQAKEQLAKFSRDGFSGLNDQAGKTYAENLFQGNGGLIPNDAKIDSATINTDGGGHIDYTDADGKKHSLDLASEAPEDGMYMPVKDACGSEFFATETSPNSAETPVGVTTDVGESAIAGTSAEDLQNAVGFDENGYVVKNDDGSLALYDGDGNEVASDVQKVGTAEEARSAYSALMTKSVEDGSTPFMIANEDGSYTLGTTDVDSDNSNKIHSFDNGYISLDNGETTLSGVNADGSKVTDMNSEDAANATWSESTRGFEQSHEVSSDEASALMNSIPHEAIDENGNVKFADGSYLTGINKDGTKVTTEDIVSGKADSASWKMTTAFNPDAPAGSAQNAGNAVGSAPAASVSEHAVTGSEANKTISSAGEWRNGSYQTADGRVLRGTNADGTTVTASDVASGKAANATWTMTTPTATGASVSEHAVTTGEAQKALGGEGTWNGTSYQTADGSVLHGTNADGTAVTAGDVASGKADNATWSMTTPTATGASVSEHAVTTGEAQKALGGEGTWNGTSYQTADGSVLHGTNADGTAVTAGDVASGKADNATWSMSTPTATGASISEHSVSNEEAKATFSDGSGTWTGNAYQTADGSVLHGTNADGTVVTEADVASGKADTATWTMASTGVDGTSARECAVTSEEAKAVANGEGTWNGASYQTADGSVLHGTNSDGTAVTEADVLSGKADTASWAMTMPMASNASISEHDVTSGEANASLGSEGTWNGASYQTASGSTLHGTNSDGTAVTEADVLSGKADDATWSMATPMSSNASVSEHDVTSDEAKATIGKGGEWNGNSYQAADGSLLHGTNTDGTAVTEADVTSGKADSATWTMAMPMSSNASVRESIATASDASQILKADGAWAGSSYRTSDGTILRGTNADGTAVTREDVASGKADTATWSKASAGASQEESMSAPSAYRSERAVSSGEAKKALDGAGTWYGNSYQTASGATLRGTNADGSAVTKNDVASGKADTATWTETAPLGHSIKGHEAANQFKQLYASTGSDGTFRMKDGGSMSGVHADGSRVTAEDMKSGNIKDASFRYAPAAGSRISAKDAAAKMAESGASIGNGGVNLANGDYMYAVKKDGTRLSPKDYGTNAEKSASWRYCSATMSPGRTISYDEAMQKYSSAKSKSAKGSKLSYDRDSQAYNYHDGETGKTSTYGRKGMESRLSGSKTEKSYDGSSVRKMGNEGRSVGSGYSFNSASEFNKSIAKGVDARVANGYVFTGHALDNAAKTTFGSRLPLGNDGSNIPYNVVGGRGLGANGSHELVVAVKDGEASALKKINLREIDPSVVSKDGKQIFSVNGKSYEYHVTNGYMNSNSKKREERSDAKEDMRKREQSKVRRSNDEKAYDRMKRALLKKTNKKTDENK